MNVTVGGKCAMVSALKVEEQLREIGFSARGWGRGEVRELCKVLADDEIILQCANGYYQNGFAMLVATNQRLILVDRKPMFLTLEAIWYDKIGQVYYNHRLLNSTLCISSPNKDISFTSVNQGRLRQILSYAQERMMAARGQNQIFSGSVRQDYPSNFPQFVHQHPISVASQANTVTLPPTDPLVDAIKDTPEVSNIYSATSLPFTRHRYFSR
jgi:hypothetical protein